MCLLQQPKYGKRPLDESGDGGGSESATASGTAPGSANGPPDGPPAAKIQCTTTTTASSSATSSGGPAKFSVEIVQQLEFTANASGATSVSVKTMTNTSVKSEVSCADLFQNF